MGWLHQVDVPAAAFAGNELVRREVLTGAEDWFRSRVAAALRAPIPPHDDYVQILEDLVVDFGALVVEGTREPFDLPLSSILGLFETPKRARSAFARHEILGAEWSEGRRRIRNPPKSEPPPVQYGVREPLIKRTVVLRSTTRLTLALDSLSRSLPGSSIGFRAFLTSLSRDFQSEVDLALREPFRRPLVQVAQSLTELRRMRKLAGSRELSKTYRVGKIWHVITPLYTARAHGQ